MSKSYRDEETDFFNNDKDNKFDSTEYADTKYNEKDRRRKRFIKKMEYKRKKDR